MARVEISRSEESADAVDAARLRGIVEFVQAAETLKDTLRSGLTSKGFDKLETLLQHVAGPGAPQIDYVFNLTYGAEQTAKHPLLAQLRAMVDEKTRARRGGR